MDIGWQQIMMASLERAGHEYEEAMHVPSGFRLRNTFLELDDSDLADESASPRCMLSSRSMSSSRSQIVPSSPEPPALPPGMWVRNGLARAGSCGSAWDQLMAEVTGSPDGEGEGAKRVRPTKPRRMKGRQLAETLFNARTLPREAAEQAARTFLHEAAGEEGLKAYACMVLRKLIDEAGKAPNP